MAKSPVDEKKRLEKLRKKIKETEKAASSSLEKSPLNKGKKVKVTLPSGKVVELDTRSSEYKSLIKNKKNKNIKSIVGIKDGRYTGMSTSGETQM